jgi:hypothetical protein
MTPQQPTSDADVESAVRAELPWLLERSRARKAAASEDTVSGRISRAETVPFDLSDMKAALREQHDPAGRSPDV